MNEERLIGRTIVAARPMTHAEAREEGWDIDGCDGAPVVIELDNGDTLYPSCDPEGNGPGAMFGVCDGQSIIHMPPVDALSDRARKVAGG